VSIALNLDHASTPARQQAPRRTSLVGLSKPQLRDALAAEIGLDEREARMRASQLWNWMYHHGVTDFDRMSNIQKGVRQKLSDTFLLDRPEIVSEQISVDGTRKWLFRYRDPKNPLLPPVEIETVYIPESDRGTLCVSSQVGCTLTCSFCHTGTQTLVRNLTAGEILGQVLMARERLGDFPGGSRPDDGGLVPAPRGSGGSEGDSRAITNVVMMGMGEPLYNYDAVKNALLIASAEDGISLSKRRITLSTSGVVPFIEPTGREIGVMLAISLHAVRDDLRDMLVPINKKYPLKELIQACRDYPGLSNARRITFEYVMLKDINDSDADARELVRLLSGIPAKINLIPFNPWPGTNYDCSSSSRIEKFADIVNKAGYASPVRTPRGRDIFAACGQLKSETERLKKKDREALTSA
jgi:23S rRNA (adenine2503-C2)-methyltransferase